MASFATELQPVPGSNASFGANPSFGIPAVAQKVVSGQTAAPWQAGSSITATQTMLKVPITRPTSTEKLVVDNDRRDDGHDRDRDHNNDAAIDGGVASRTNSSWPKKRPRSTKDYLVTIPRTDIRRLYPRMMMNIFNGHDPRRVHSFFMTYSVPSMAATYESFGAIDLTPAPTRSYVSATPTYLHGPHRMALFYATMLQLNPDQILRVHGAKARVDTERRVTEISCVMVHEFTQLYAVNPMQITDEIVNFIVAEEATKQQQQQQHAAASDHVSDASTASLTSEHDEDEEEDEEDAEEEGDDEEVAEETSTSAASASASASASVALSAAVASSPSPSLTTASSSSSSSLSSTAKPAAPAPLAHRPEERRRSRKKMSRRTAVHDDRDVVFPDTFDLYRRIYRAEVPRMETPPSIRIQYEYVIVVDALRRLLLVDFHNPQVTVVV